MRWSVIVRLLLGLAVLLVAAMFTIQNVSRTSPLSLDLYVYAWQLARPVAIPWLIWGSFGVGFVAASLVGWMRRRGLARTVTRLEQEALLRSAGRPPAAVAKPAAVASPAAPAAGDDWGR